MNDHGNTNPYAPTQLDAEPAAKLPLVVSRELTSLRLCLVTIMSVTASGAAFGLVLVAATAIFGARAPNQEMVYAAASATIAGGFLAAISAAVTVPALLLAWRSFQGTRICWEPASIRWFAAMAGFCSGYGCIAVPALLSAALEALVWALLPAGFGCLGSLVLIEPTVRRTRGGQWTGKPPGPNSSNK